MATVIKVDGSTHEISKFPKLPALQQAVGGYIELVRLSGGRVMYVNEEGRLNGLLPNMAASTMANQVIVGDVVVLTAEEVEADSGP